MNLNTYLSVRDGVGHKLTGHKNTCGQSLLCVCVTESKSLILFQLKMFIFEKVWNKLKQIFTVVIIFHCLHLVFIE